MKHLMIIIFIFSSVAYAEQFEVKVTDNATGSVVAKDRGKGVSVSSVRGKMLSKAVGAIDISDAKYTIDFHSIQSEVDALATERSSRASNRIESRGVLLNKLKAGMDLGALELRKVLIHLLEE